jgi:hypothetical protein
MLRNALLAAGLGMTVMAGAAEAGQVVVKSDGWYVARVSFTTGTGSDGWQTIHLGETLSSPVVGDTGPMDDRKRFVQISYHNLIGWQPLCTVPLDPSANTTIRLTGAFFTSRCEVNGLSG